MRSKPSSTAEPITLDTPIERLNSTSRPSAHMQSLQEAGLRTVDDLLWALPLRTIPMPRPGRFREAREGQLFLGSGSIIHREIRPAFGRRTKGRFLLHNAYIVVKELDGDATMPLRFFNIYPQ